MNDKSNKSRAIGVKRVHTIVPDKNIAGFLKAMADFDEATGKNRKLHLAANLIKMLAVSDIGSAAEAAGKKSSSDFSNGMHMLEKFFGGPLRDGIGQQVRFNEQGKELVQLTRFILISFADFYNKCHSTSPRYVIAAGDSILHLLLLPRLAKIQEKLPDVLFEVRDLGTGEIREALRECRIDFALVDKDAIAGLKGIENKSVGTFGYSVFCPRKLLPTESNESSCMQAPFALSKHWGIDVLEMAKAADIHLNVKFWCGNYSQVGRLVRLESCAGIMPRFAATIFKEKYYVSKVPDFLSKIEKNLALGWNRRLEKIRPHFNKVAQVLEKELSF